MVFSPAIDPGRPHRALREFSLAPIFLRHSLILLPSPSSRRLRRDTWWDLLRTLRILLDINERVFCFCFPKIRHYCDNALSIIMAYPSENPVLAANFQFLFDGVRGTDSAVESLRMALLGVAAVHQSFLLSRSGMSSLAADESLRIGDTFRAKSMQLLTSACATQEGAQNDAALAATVAIALIDVSGAVRFLRDCESVSTYLHVQIFSGGRNWAKSLDFAKGLVKSRGGPGLLLARSKGHKANSVAGVSRARLLLEIVAVYELFGDFLRCTTPHRDTPLTFALSGCLARGTAPSLLNIDCWWFVLHPLRLLTCF